MSSNKSSALSQLATVPYAENLGFYTQIAKALEDNTPYFAALGRFVVEYAGAEIALHELARKLSDLSAEKAEIIFGKMRRKDIADRICHLMKLDKADNEKIELVEECIKQLDVIALERGKFVHQLVTIEEPALFSFLGKHIKVENPLKSKPSQPDDRKVFTLEHVTQMSHDCSVIHLRLIVVRFPNILDGRLSEDTSYMRSAWHYKLPQPKTPKKRRMKARKERKLQRASSRG